MIVQDRSNGLWLNMQLTIVETDWMLAFRLAVARLKQWKSKLNRPHYCWILINTCNYHYQLNNIKQAIFISSVPGKIETLASCTFREIIPSKFYLRHKNSQQVSRKYTKFASMFLVSTTM